MAREFKRTDRVAEQLQRELAQIIQLEIKDPRVGMVTVSGVEVSRDLYYATAYVTFLGIGDDQASNKAALEILNQAAGFVRSQVGKRMQMRIVPQLRFVFDKSISHGSEMSALIKKAREKDLENANEENSNDEKPSDENSTNQ